MPADGEAVWRVRSLSPLASGASTPFVGRHRERGQFAAALESCRETGRGQSLLVRGEAGIGKSRLLEECAAVAAGQGFACHKVPVLDFGAEQDPVRVLVCRLLGQPPGAAGESIQAAAERAVEQAWVDRDRRPELYDLLGLPQPPAANAVLAAMDSATRR